MKLYYRDKSGVMRAIPGIVTYGPNQMLFITKSVYKITRNDSQDFVFEVKE